MFSVIADEVTDNSNKEQLSLTVRYVDLDTLLVPEDLFGFVKCDTGISGRDLAGKMAWTSSICEGWHTMEQVTWLVLLTVQQLSSSLQIILWHYLNLAVVSLLQVTSVHNMMGVVGRVFQFFASHPKQHRHLRNQ